ncbi:hypothetical protein D769_19253 [Cupriavidus sp. HMR-1]|uniref:DUF927 domain-containing protein n=1 Tax=Cupriavidus sp. HMR-1 TaxID=1249621 RepID=UPI0002A39C71|nr:DUF927 domain-containing protein [Cupriavidus sp. HMR-1]EKZ97626.1 hypothetical protein D769_19253 [Cupriavidus sp. HMR-1]
MNIQHATAKIGDVLARGEVVTVIRAERPTNKRFLRGSDGSIEKAPTLLAAEFRAAMHYVPDAATMADLLTKVSEDPCAAIINSGFLGVELGEPFTILAESDIERRFGVKGRDETQGIHRLQDGTKVLGRLKENCVPSAWILLDRDTDEHTPPELAALDRAAWLKRVNDLLPGVDGCDYVFANSASRRVVCDGRPVGGGNGHTWVRVANPTDVPRLRTGLIGRAWERRLAWAKPRRNKHGDIVGQSPATILDISVWNVGRIVFCGKPTVEGDGLAVEPQTIEVESGPFSSTLDTSRIELPSPGEATKLAKSAGFNICYRGNGSSMIADAYDLTSQTEIEVKGRGLMTVGQAAELLPQGGRLRCQAPFRDSSSWAAFLCKGNEGRLYVYDSATETKHWLSDYDWAVMGFESLPEPTPEQEVLAAEIAARNAEKAEISQPYGNGSFSRSASGVFWIGADEEGNLKNPLFLCSLLRIVAVTCDEKSGEWGRLLEWRDRAGVLHRWAMPMELLQGDAADMRRELARGGLEIATGRGARDMLSTYLQAWKIDTRAKCVSRLGWHDMTYVTRDEAIGDAGKEAVVFQNASAIEPALSQSGTAEEWRAAVAAPANGNTRIMLALCIALAAPLAKLANIDSGGFHLRGNSSCGKTTLLGIAASVWGEPGAYMHTWRATANAMEGLAASHNDGLLILDEMGQVDPAEAGEIAYMLANGQGKSRATRTGVTRPSAQWRLMFLSSGELGLSAHMAQGGKLAKAGQEVRLADIEADAGAGMGAFEQLHDHTTPAEFAHALKDGAARFYGTVGFEWLRHIVADRAKLADVLRRQMELFCKVWVSAGTSGQVQRVVRRFVLVAAAGELATSYGLTGWETGEAERAVRACFDAWFEGFGGAGNREERALLSQVKAFIEANGASRFQPFRTSEVECEETWGGSPNDTRIINRVGFVRIGAGDLREYIVLPESFKNDICKGFDPKMATRTLMENGWLKPDSDGKPQRKERLPGLNRARCYVLTPRMD